MADLCKHGHELTPEVVGFTNGRRVCKLCSRERVREHLRKKRMALRAKGLTTRGKRMSWGWRIRLGVM